ncbi:BTB/POZ domain-containing protein [Candidatus Protochlamydia sp. R18]|uniref:BTB/POZ domain-containing protein n=1 Tax=Candidatus Protochlamydia sp. R18 TaxID=1353977 RepID=UPI0006946519|nr:BTB/POZ domain-containing protein [Candidatus Protochlamydia sp. R18]
MHIYNLNSHQPTPIVNSDTQFYSASNERLKFFERISLLCKTIFQSFLNLFFNYINRDQLQSQWREIFWGRKEIVTTRPESSVSLSSSAQTSSFAPPSSILRFQNGNFLIIPSSQISFLMEKSPYFKNLWSGNFQETLQTPLALTQKEFTILLKCLVDVDFKVPLKSICSFIQLADYYQLTEVVKNLEQQLLSVYKSEKGELFNSNEDNLVKLKELLNFAQQYKLNTLKNYLELTVVSSLLKQASHLNEFEKILNYFSNEIEGLNFSEKGSLTDTHLLALKNCKNLKELYLKDCYGLTAAGLAHLTSLVTLQHLDLSGYPNLTDAGLAHLTSLVALQHLDLRECRKLTDAGLAHLTPLVALQHLDLRGCRDFTDAGLAHLTPLVALEHLDLSGCTNLTDAGLAHLTSLVALQHLNLGWCPNLTDAGLAHLTSLVALQHLDLRECRKLTDAGLAYLTSLVALQYLDLSGCSNLTDAGLAHLTPLEALQHLDLRGCCKLTEAGLAHLTSLVTVKKFMRINYNSI